MFRKILIGTDLSPDSGPLVSCMAEVKGVGGEEIILAHVVHVSTPPGLDDVLREESRDLLERQTAKLQGEGFKVTVELTGGFVAPALASAADRHDVSLIVVGSHERGLLGEAVPGSVSTRLLHLTRRPVLVFPLHLLEEGQAAVCRSLFGSILLATDFSDAAERVIPFASKMSVETGAPVTLFHVLEKGLSPQEEKGKRFLLDAKRQRLLRQGVREVSVELGRGDPGEEIGRKAREGNFSLALMGRTKQGIVREIVLGSTTKEVIRRGGVPVMVIPPEFR